MEIDAITCRAEPNPIPDLSHLNKRQRAHERADIGSDPFAPKRGFLASGEDAICLFQICFRDAAFVIPGGINVHFDPSSYTLFVHRSSFLTMSRRYEGTCDSPPPADGGPRRIAWADWGPPVSRWFDATATATPTRWITTSAGQRCVMIHNNAGAYCSSITILDFNPFNICKMKAKFKREKEMAKGKLEMTTADCADEEDRSLSTSEIGKPVSSGSRSRVRTSQDVDVEEESDMSGVVGEMDVGEDEDHEFLVTMDDDSEIFVPDNDVDSDSMPGLESVVDSDEECLTTLAGYTANPQWQDHRHPGLAHCRVVESPSGESPGPFSEEVVGRLPYIEYVSEREYQYKGVLLDEERILGLTVRFSSLSKFFFY